MRKQATFAQKSHNGVFLYITMFETLMENRNWNSFGPPGKFQSRT